MVGLWECHHLLTPGNNSDFSHSTCSSPSVARTTGSREGNSPKKVSQRGRPGPGHCQADCPARWWGFWRPWEWRSSLPKSAVNNVHISLSPNDGSLKSHDLEVPLHLEYWLLPSLANNPPTSSPKINARLCKSRMCKLCTRSPSKKLRKPRMSTPRSGKNSNRNPNRALSQWWLSIPRTRRGI